MVKGFCSVCCKWVPAGTLMPCLDRIGDLPKPTCGLLKSHTAKDFPETTFDDVRSGLDAAVEAFLPSALAIERGPDVPPPVWSESIPEDAADLFDGTEWAPQVTKALSFDSLKAEGKSIKSDGGSTGYYNLPDNALELNDLIEYKDMPFARGNIFKACYRLGEKDSVDALYDINKIIFFAERMKGALVKGSRV